MWVEEKIHFLLFLQCFQMLSSLWSLSGLCGKNLRTLRNKTYVNFVGNKENAGT